METIEICSKFISGFATISAAIIAGYIANKYQKNNLKLSREKMEKDLFTEFNGRYDILNDSMELLSAINSIEELKSTQSLIKDKKMYNVVIDYFNLCSEQYYWKEKKRISKKIWLSWEAGMKHYFKIEIVKELWDKEINDFGYEAYYLKEGQSFFDDKIKTPIDNSMV